MSGQCNSPCATINERRRGMMNKFQGLIDCYDNQPYKDRMRCPPATLREFPTLVERSQLVACYPVCPAPPCDPCPSLCMPCPPPCLPPCPAPCPPCLPCPPPCPPPACYPCPPCPSPYDQVSGGQDKESEYARRCAQFKTHVDDWKKQLPCPPTQPPPCVAIGCPPCRWHEPPPRLKRFTPNDLLSQW